MIWSLFYETCTIAPGRLLKEVVETVFRTDVRGGFWGMAPAPVSTLDDLSVHKILRRNIFLYLIEESYIYILSTTLLRTFVQLKIIDSYDKIRTAKNKLFRYKLQAVEPIAALLHLVAPKHLLLCQFDFLFQLKQLFVEGHCPCGTGP